MMSDALRRIAEARGGIAKVAKLRELNAGVCIALCRVARVREAGAAGPRVDPNVCYTPTAYQGCF